MFGTMFAQGVDLAYIQAGISGVLFWVLNFENLYFLGTGHSCCIFMGSQINDIFLSVLCLERYFYAQFYSPGTSANTALHYYHLVVNFRKINCVLRGYFLEFHFSESIFLGFLSVAKYFLGLFRNTQLR